MDPKTIARNLAKNPKERRAVAKKSFYYFLLIYGRKYLTYDLAPFQKEMIRLVEDEDIQTLVISGFRGCGKSSIITTFYIMWSMMGIQQKKFPLLICKNLDQAKQQLKNIKHELEDNKLLKRDLGPFEERHEWNSSSLLLKDYGSRITATSIEQSIRGIRHEESRPDVIICDDIESLESTRTIGRRNKTYDLLTKEIIPAGDKNTRLIVLGNVLHEDSTINRLRKSIESKKLKGIFRKYPIVNEKGESLWPAKFPDAKTLKAEEMRIGNSQVWAGEYLLKIISDDDAVCRKEWLSYYVSLPS